MCSCGKRGFVLVMVNVIMIAVASYSLLLLSKAQSYVHILYSTIGKEKDKLKSRIESVSLLNVALAVMKNRTSDIHFTSVRTNQDMINLLDEWLEKTNTVPDEASLWNEIYNEVKNEGQGALMNDVSSYGNLVQSLIQNGVLSEDILETSKAAVFRFFMPPSLCYLLIVKNGPDILWATASSKTLNQYLFVTNHETLTNGRPIYFVSGDVLDGPVYTTDVINISGDPIFKGSVTAKDLNIERGNPTFENGFNQLVGEPEFVLDDEFANNTINDIRASVKNISDITNGDITGIYLPSNEFPNDARVDGVYIDENTGKIVIYSWEGGRRWGSWTPVYEIVYDSTPLNDDGTMNATLTDLESDQQVRFKFNGLILSEPDLYISDPDETSFFFGLISLASEDDVYIRGNIVYSHLRDSYLVDDVSVYNDLSEGKNYNKLNIIAYDNVVMRYYVPYDLYITASIYALTGEFTLEDYYWYKKDKLHIFGAIIQKWRGPIGTFDPRTGESLTGFLKDYVYDRRLYAPPYPYKTPTMGGKISVLDIR